MDIETIARTAHESVRGYLSVLSSTTDLDNTPWDNVPEERKERILAEVEWWVDHPDAPIFARHDEWCLSKLADGWKHGYQLRPDSKEHPNIGPYSKLSYQLRVRDAIWYTIIRQLAPLLVTSTS